MLREGRRSRSPCAPEELFAHSENGLDTGDIERVHAMRVATRRLRAVLEIFSPCFRAPSTRAGLRDVRALADALGERRDPDVQLEALGRSRRDGRRGAAGLEVFADRIRAEQPGQRLLAPRCSSAPRRSTCRAGCGSWRHEGAQGQGARPGGAPRRERRADRRRAARRARGVRPARARPRQVEALHDMRIAAKRLRYVLEVTAEPCFGPYARTAAKRVKELQDLLGEIHDCDVTVPRVLELIEELRGEAVAEVLDRAGDADDLDPALAATTPDADAWRGLEAMVIHLRARREVLFARFLAFWTELEREGFRRRLEYAIAERPAGSR
jgi:CHAD domain-containing protein